MGFSCWDVGDAVGFAVAIGMISFYLVGLCVEIEGKTSDMTLKIRVLCLVLALLVTGPPAQVLAKGCHPRPFTGAGVLPYAQLDGRTLLLLGYESGRGWLGFGGKPKMVNTLDEATLRCETPVETAAREGFEEMRRVVAYREIMAAIDVGRYLPPSAGPGDFRAYTIKIDYTPTTAFRQIPTPSGSDYDKIQDYYWIDLEVLTQIVTAGEALLPQSPNGGRLWKPAFSDFEETLHDEALRLRLFP